MCRFDVGQRGIGMSALGIDLGIGKCWPMVGHGSSLMMARGGPCHLSLSLVAARVVVALGSLESIAGSAQAAPLTL